MFIATQELHPLTTTDDWVLLPSVSPSTVVTQQSTTKPPISVASTTKPTITTTTFKLTTSAMSTPNTSTPSSTFMPSTTATTTITTTTKPVSIVTTTTAIEDSVKLNITSEATSTTENIIVVSNATTEVPLNVSSTIIPEVTKPTADKPVNMSDYTQGKSSLRIYRLIVDCYLRKRIAIS